MDIQELNNFLKNNFYTLENQRIYGIKGEYIYRCNNHKAFGKSITVFTENNVIKSIIGVTNDLRIISVYLL